MMFDWPNTGVAAASSSKSGQRAITASDLQKKAAPGRGHPARLSSAGGCGDRFRSARILRGGGGCRLELGPGQRDDEAAVVLAEAVERQLGADAAGRHHRAVGLDRFDRADRAALRIV